jgi:hypothetical protein
VAPDFHGVGVYIAAVKFADQLAANLYQQHMNVTE